MDVRGLTITSENTREYNHSIWVDASSRGWVLTVCVSNVADAISIDGPFDKSAKTRLESRDGRPMLPKRFSEGSCSLVASERRSVIAIRIRLDNDLDIQGSPTIDVANIFVSGNLSHADVAAVTTDISNPLHEQLSRAYSLSNALAMKRRKLGALVMYDSNTGWMSNDEGRLYKLESQFEIIGHTIINESMILVNCEIAKYCIENDVPIPFVNHHKDGMSYSENHDGHFGLHVPAYVRCTSPLSRYMDLVSQRQILQHTRGVRPRLAKQDIAALCDYANSYVAKKAIAATTDDKILRRKRTEFEKKISNAISNKIAIDENEFTERLWSGEVTVSCLRAILFEPSCLAKQSIISYILLMPHLATEIVSQCKWGKPSFQVSSHGIDNEMAHTVSVYYKKMKIESPKIVSKNLKTAKHIANLHALCIAIGIDGPT